MKQLNERDKENETLRDDLNRLRSDMKMQEEIDDSGGLSRENVTSKEWHAKHENAAPFLFGFKSFGETIAYICRVFFTDVEYKFGKGKDPLTDFEQCLVYMLKVCRGYEDETIKMIFHRTGHSFVADVMNKWSPKFSFVGLCMSILDLDFTTDYVSAEYAREHGLDHYSFDHSPKDKYRNYIEATVPQEYIGAGYRDVGALVDGMVIRTDTVRVNPVITRMTYNDKVDDHGGLIMTWTTPTGLCFEHTGLYLGRVPEMRLVELWGTVDSNNLLLN